MKPRYIANGFRTDDYLLTMYPPSPRLHVVENFLLWYLVPLSAQELKNDAI